jgi:cytochrome c peroxidase
MKSKLTILSTAVVAIILVLLSCGKKRSLNENETSSDYRLQAGDVPDYRKSANDHLANLGKVLFYDKNLSFNNSVSCSNCHQQSRAFCDNERFSTGLQDLSTKRNTPSIFAKTGKVFWDGRSSGMDDLVLRPIKDHIEMGFENIHDLVNKLKNIEYYPELFTRAFKTSQIDSSRIQMALSEFLKNFDFSNNKFQRVQNGQDQFNASEQNGRDIFFGKGQCSACHHLESFNFPGDSLSSGYGETNISFNIGLDEVYVDKGVGGVTGRLEDEGKFMVPVLLNVEFTAPYMHDGRFKTLDEVVEHYNSGVKNHPNLNSTLRDMRRFENMTEEEFLAELDKNGDGFVSNEEASAIQPLRLGLNENEKRNLVDFLRTLSDQSVFTDRGFSNPFVNK